MAFPELDAFRLVGGTALALQTGHRKSVDIDFFCAKQFDSKRLQFFLMEQFEKFVLDWENKNGFTARIDDVKADFFNWNIDFVYSTVVRDTIRLSDKREIAAMKLEAITTRKEKKDFIDIAVLLREFTFKELLSAFRIKYPFISHKFVIESLAAVDYADEAINPEMIIDYNWEDVKRDIQLNVERYFFNQVDDAKKKLQERLHKAEDLLKKKKDTEE